MTDKSGNVLENQAPVEGAILHMTTHIPPTMSDNVRSNSTTTTITFVDQENHKISWTYSAPFSWLLRSVRWQSVTAIDNGKAKYETIEVFSGALVVVLRSLMGKDLQQSFEAMGEALKERSEHGT